MAISISPVPNSSPKSATIYRIYTYSLSLSLSLSFLSPGHAKNQIFNHIYKERDRYHKSFSGICEVWLYKESESKKKFARPHSFCLSSPHSNLVSHSVSLLSLSLLVEGTSLFLFRFSFCPPLKYCIFLLFEVHGFSRYRRILGLFQIIWVIGFLFLFQDFLYFCDFPHVFLTILGGFLSNSILGFMLCFHWFRSEISGLF